MIDPVVSVVMVVCNADRFLEESIRSVLGQTLKNFEFIIVDYGSTDCSNSIIASYAAVDDRIRFHEIPHCVLPAARNAGCSLARGKYIAIMDADDICLPDRLRCETEFMEEHPQVGVVGGAVALVNAAGREFGRHTHPSEDRDIRSEMADHCSFWHPTVLLRKEAFTLAGGYRTAFIYAHDYDLELRISEQFQCANLQQAVLRYRIHAKQISIRNRRKQTDCKLAVQASATFRRNGCVDPLDTVPEITSALLTEWGVTENKQRTDFANDSRDWIRNMYWAGEYSIALTAGVETLRSSDWKYTEKRPIADIQMVLASIYWRQKRFLASFSAVGRAVKTRPAIAGRPLKQLLFRLQLI